MLQRQETPLLAAAEKNHVEAISFLLENKANIDAVDKVREVLCRGTGVSTECDACACCSMVLQL